MISPIQSRMRKDFFGRATETGDVIYYLNNARQSDRPIHLAFVGDRASGKTSFLNMAELEAKRRNFCTVRINLNEGDVASDLNFFRKLLHSVITSAYNLGAFGGKNSPSFLSYLDLIATGKTNDNDHILFLSAFFIAKGLHSGSADVGVPDDLLAEDLKTIQAEVSQPIVLLFDECNVLSSNRILLEKLRNIFMNLTGFMMIFAATGDFFPVMDDVFSPIMRQFKRIDIGPFKEVEDVKECIQQPLRLLGLTHREIRSIVSEVFMREVDTLTGRRPYEIQLICHTLFRSCQEGRVKRFALDLATLENIQREIASGKNLNEREAIKAVRSLNRKMMTALDAVSSSSDLLSADDWWRIEYLFKGTSRWTEPVFKEAVAQLVDHGPLHLNEREKLAFSGDDFDRIYIRYYARSKNSLVRLWNMPLEPLMFAAIANFLSEFDSLVPLGGISESEYLGEVSNFVKFLQGDFSGNSENLSIFEDLISAIIKFPEKKALTICEVYYNSNLATGQFWMIWAEPEHRAGLKKFYKRLAEMVARGDEVGVSVTVNSWEIEVPNTSDLVSLLVNAGNVHLNTRMASVFMEMVRAFYVNHKDKSTARRMAEGAYALSGSRLHTEANNVGYLYMAEGNFEESSLWFMAARQYANEGLEGLLEYNIGTLAALSGDFRQARIELGKVSDREVEQVACVHRLLVVDGKLRSEEVESPKSLVELANEALNAMDAVEVVGGTFH